MLDCRVKRIIDIALIMNKGKYKTNEVIIRRINNYNYNEHTTITHNDIHIKISTETNIKGVENVLYLYPDGESELTFECN